MHRIFTFQTKIRQAKRDTLAVYLERLRVELLSPISDLPFVSLTKIHFVSLVIVPDDRFGDLLVFENNIDGTIDAYIEDLCDLASAALHTIYAMCEGYDASNGFERGEMRAYLRRHLVVPSAGFVGNVGRSVARIRSEHDLRDGLETHLDELRDGDRLGATPDRIYAQLRARVAATSAWALQPKARLSGTEMLKRRLRAAAFVWCGLAALPILLPLGAIFIIVLLAHELRDRSVIDAPDARRMAAITATEDNILQNHFASIVDVKPSRFRRATLRCVLSVTKLAASLSTDGTLSNLDNIHFAHWVLIDGGRRMLFLTNYDGSWENYLDDFIDKASAGLTAIWSNCKLREPYANFPRTWLLVNGGARDERNFKNIARGSQLPTNLWYSAYPTITVPRIESNSAIRDGLATPPHGDGVDAWIQRL